jgi:hypothetical protein
MVYGPANTLDWDENHPDVDFVVVAGGDEQYFTSYKEAALAAIDAASERRDGRVDLEVRVLSEDAAHWWDGETYAGEELPYTQTFHITVREQVR